MHNAMRLAWLAIPLCVACGRKPHDPEPQSTAAAADPRGADHAEIERLVRRLAEVDAAGIGYSPSLAGNQFLPIAGTDEPGMLLLNQPPPERSAVLERLVRIGVPALPALIECTADPTPTRLPPMKALMWMSHADEYDVNRRTTPRPTGVDRDPGPEHPVEHVVAVGDLCFVAIGQIVNRSFAAVRYQPSGGLVISSPPRSPALRAALRAEWAGLTEAGHRTSLLRDIAEPDHEQRRTGGLERLAYYYPDAARAAFATLRSAPAYDADAVRALVRELYVADAALRDALFRAFVRDHGEAGRDGILHELFEDLARQEAYEQKRVSPPTSGSDVRARQCLIQLYGQAATVTSADRPYPRFAASHERERLIASAKRAGLR